MHLVSIQALRGLAALCVALYHSLEYTGFHLKFDFGALGVQVFFVISGFIMVWTTARAATPPTPTGFLANRIVRVVPLYWLATLLLTGQHLRAGHEVLLGDLVRSLLFIPFASHLDPGLDAPILVAGWTLSFEMFFYAVFAVSLHVQARLGAGQVRRWVAALLLACVVAGWVLQPQAVPLRVLSSWMLLQFLSGMGLAAWCLRHGRLPSARWVALAGVGVALFFRYRSPADGWAVAAAVLGAGLIVVGFLALGRMTQFVGTSAFRACGRLGDASYSLYLFHPFAIGPLHKHLVANWPPVLAVPVLVAGSVLIGWLAHRVLERPLLDHVRAWRRLQPARV